MLQASPVPHAPLSLLQPPVRSRSSSRVAARSSSMLTQDFSSEDSTDAFGSDAFSTFPGTALTSPWGLGVRVCYGGWKGNGYFEVWPRVKRFLYFSWEMYLIQRASRGCCSQHGKGVEGPPAAVPQLPCAHAAPPAPFLTPSTGSPRQDGHRSLSPRPRDTSVL